MDNNTNLAYLYLLTEDDNDDLFFEMCAERISGKSFYQIEPRRLRKNGGITEVRKKLPAFLNDLKGASHLDAYFVIAMDNDRAADHYNGHERITGLSTIDSTKQCRHCEIENKIKEVWGSDTSKWPISGAIAVPVEMLESWILISLDPDCSSDLPCFSKRTQQIVKNFYSSNPPKQLKDLLKEKQIESGLHKGEFLLKVAEEMDLDTLETKSESFRAFREQVSEWS